MSQKDVENKIPIYKLKTTDEVMKYYDDWGVKNKYDQDMVDWKYSGPKEAVEVFKNMQKIKILKYMMRMRNRFSWDRIKKFGFNYYDGADLSQKLLDLVPKNLYQKLSRVDLNKDIKFKIILMMP